MCMVAAVTCCNGGLIRLLKDDNRAGAWSLLIAKSISNEHCYASALAMNRRVVARMEWSPA